MKRIKISRARELLGYATNKSILNLGVTLYPLNPAAKRKTYLVDEAEIMRLRREQNSGGRSR